MKTLPNDGVSADIENLDSLNDEALARLAQNGSSDAEHTLVVRFMPLVRIKARPYFLIGADHSDLVQEGSIGLFSAIRDYDCEKHTSFRTYANLCIGLHRQQHYCCNKTRNTQKALSAEQLYFARQAGFFR